MIRPIVTSDFPFIYHLYMSHQTNPYLLYEMMESEDFQPIFDELLNEGIIYIFEYDGLQKGMFKLIPQKHRASHSCYLGGLAIDPCNHNQGYGTKMMQEIISFARKSGYKRIELSTYVNNNSAIKLYEKMGFQREGVMKNYSYFKSKDEYWDEVLMAYLF